MVRGRVKKLFITSIMIILSLFIYSTPADAQSYGNSATYPVSSCVHTVGPVGNVQKYVTGSISNQGCYMYQDGQTGGVSGQVNSMSIVFQNQIPAPAIVSFDINISGSNIYNGFYPSGSNWALLDENVTRYGDNNAVSWNVHLSWYIKNPTNNIALGNYMAWVAGNSVIQITPATVILLYDPVSANDIQQLKDKLNSIDQNVVIGDQRLDFILNEIRSNQQQQQQQQQQQEQQGQQGQTDSNTAGQQVEGATTNLISVIGGFFGAFINASPTNCVFNMGIILEEVDMCSAYIPTTYNVILSIVSLLFIVPMVIWLINSILNAFREFQE